ncbi:exodeoxyribonuclease VII small subunit [Desulfohalobiaceae bacterium Ax17]|uniref:exodeoxyribonuclease VII small subunit n=1 Tax=Desulfovulcanus ferrireducens TaxID=2831190 RepID=UPI00207BBA75|nr:exodeoxyribonuclease VII small subunit [Desulfovulcanus ferrireducens]MBT8762948.1 exodeoxyribonuclease VII small subunit [Desulfovulcanus ferrireducens]
MAKKSSEFEKNLQKLQKIVEQLEQGDLPLEKGVDLFKQGLSLVYSCRQQLEKAKHEVSVFIQETEQDKEE